MWFLSYWMSPIVVVRILYVRISSGPIGPHRMLKQMSEKMPQRHESREWDPLKKLEGIRCLCIVHLALISCWWRKSFFGQKVWHVYLNYPKMKQNEGNQDLEIFEFLAFECFDVSSTEAIVAVASCRAFVSNASCATTSIFVPPVGPKAVRPWDLKVCPMRTGRAARSQWKYDFHIESHGIFMVLRC